jgi:hypothetical protein
MRILRIVHEYYKTEKETNELDLQGSQPDNRKGVNGFIRILLIRTFVL